MTTDRAPIYKRAAFSALSAALIALAPVLANPVRLWDAAHCTLCQVTVSARTFYDAVRLVYCAQYPSEHRIRQNRARPHQFTTSYLRTPTKVEIRGEPHSVMQAINRQIAHYAYDVGQIVLLAKHFRSAN